MTSSGLRHHAAEHRLFRLGAVKRHGREHLGCGGGTAFLLAAGDEAGMIMSAIIRWQPSDKISIHRPFFGNSKVTILEEKGSETIAITCAELMRQSGIVAAVVPPGDGARTPSYRARVHKLEPSRRQSSTSVRRNSFARRSMARTVAAPVITSTLTPHRGVLPQAAFPEEAAEQVKETDPGPLPGEAGGERRAVDVADEDGGGEKSFVGEGQAQAERSAASAGMASMGKMWPPSRNSIE